MARVTCSTVGSTIECRIKAWKHWQYIIMWPPMSLFWILAASDMLSKLPKGGRTLPGYAGIVIWSLFGCLFTLAWLINVFGTEIVTISHNQLTIKNDYFFGVGHTRRFELSKIRYLQTNPPLGPPNMWRISILGICAKEDWQKFQSSGTIVFAYGRKKIRFAQKLREDEVQLLLTRLKDYLPGSSTTARDQDIL